MQEKMKPCFKKNLTRTKAIILKRINKDVAISDEKMKTLLVFHPDSAAVSECIEELEEDE